jgi:hypothetical protein
MEPINYLAQVADPFAQATQGLKLGAGMADLQRQQEARAAQQQQAQLAAQEQARFFTNPNPTMRDAARYASLLSPEQSKAFFPFMEGITKEQQQGVLKSTGQILSALQTNPQTGIKLLQDRALAARNTGDEEDATLFERLATAAADPTQGPQIAFKALVQSSAAIPGSKEMFETIDKGLGTAREEALAPSVQREAVAAADKAVADATTAQATAKNAEERAKADADKAKADADKARIDAQYAGPLAQASLNLNSAQIKNINNEISTRAAKLNLDRETMQATVAEKLSSIQKNLNEMPADTRKLVNESAVTAAASKQSANQYNDLARRLDAEGGGYGQFTSARDYLNKAFGTQSSLTELRQEYTRIRNSAAIKSLPPGVATDKDIELALKGIPPENANASTMASFLRGMAKMQDIDASVANAKTDWLSQNNGVLTRARNTFQAGDYATKPGESFNDFTQRVVQDVSKRYNPATQSTLVQQIPTDQNPRPAAATSNIRSQADAILSGGR